MACSPPASLAPLVLPSPVFQQLLLWKENVQAIKREDWGGGVIITDAVTAASTRQSH